MKTATIGLFGLISILVFLIVIGPFLTIWSLNTLFGTGISYTITSWAAAFWLQIVFASGLAGRKSS